MSTESQRSSISSHSASDRTEPEQAVRRRDRYDSVVTSGRYAAKKLLEISATQEAQWDRIKKGSSSTAKTVRSQQDLATIGAWNKGLATWDKQLNEMRKRGETEKIDNTMGQISAEEKDAIILAIGQSVIDQEGKLAGRLKQHHLILPDGKKLDATEMAEISHAIAYLSGQHDNISIDARHIASTGNRKDFEALMKLIDHGIIAPNHANEMGTLLHEIARDAHEESASASTALNPLSIANRVT